MMMSVKQWKIKIEKRIKLNHNIDSEDNLPSKISAKWLIQEINTNLLLTGISRTSGGYQHKGG